MNKSELKQRLKPIIKECVAEVLIEQGLLSNIISEVVRGLAPLRQQPGETTQDQEHIQMLEAQKKELERQKLELENDRRQGLKEQKKKLLNAAGFQTNIFEGVEPLSSGGPPPSESNVPNQAGALAGVEPGDAGVDITGIMAVGSHAWKRMV